eukprot:6445016-Alexandrium_andersonii.AAC.1
MTCASLTPCGVSCAESFWMAKTLAAFSEPGPVLTRGLSDRIGVGAYDMRSIGSVWCLVRGL